MKEECKGGKKSKQRVTIAFFVNAMGQSEYLPVVIIWKSKNPHCFKGVRKESLPCSILLPTKIMDDRGDIA